MRKHTFLDILTKSSTINHLSQQSAVEKVRLDLKDDEEKREADLEKPAIQYSPYSTYFCHNKVKFNVNSDSSSYHVILSSSNLRT